MRGAMDEIEADVAVVGAGLSGLVAAADLKAAGLEVAIVEARDRVGGRLLNETLTDGRVIDLGGAYFGPAGHVIAELARSLDVASYATYDEGDSRLFDGHRARSFRGFLPGVALPARLDAAQAVARLERMGRTVPLGEPWAAPRAAEWDAQTLWSWTQANMATDAGRGLLNLASQTMCGAEAAEVSLLHTLSYASSNGGFQYVLAVTEGSQQRRFVGGAQGLCLRLAQALEGELHLERAVARVEHGADSVRLTGPGFTCRARWAVLALPVPLAGRLVYDPPLPNARDQLAQRMTPGSTIKVFAVYDYPFWRARGLNGQAVRVDAEGFARAVLDATPPEGDPGVLEVFVVGEAARRFGRSGSEQATEAVLAELAAYFGPEATRPDRVIVQNWLEEPYTRGCYHSFAQCGVYRAFGKALRTPIGRLHVAGSESGGHAMGSMGGAVDGGRRAAAEIVAAQAGLPAPRHTVSI